MEIFDLQEHAGEETSGEEAVAMVAAKAVEPKPPNTKKEGSQDHSNTPNNNMVGDAPSCDYLDDGQPRKEEDGPKRACEAAQGKVDSTAEDSPFLTLKKSAGDVDIDESKKEGEGSESRPKKPEGPSVKRTSGAQRRKLKKKNPNKEDSNDGDGSEKTTDNEPVGIEEDKQEMKLGEYEKKLGKKPVETKKVDNDARMNLENVHGKGKKAAAKEGKDRKEMTLEECEKKLGKKKVQEGKDRKEMNLEEYDKKLGKTSLEPSKPVERKIAPLKLEGARLLERKGKVTIEDCAIELFGKRFPPRLYKIGVVDNSLHLTLRNLGVSLGPVLIYRKGLSVAERVMAKRHMEGENWQARHGVRFPLASTLTAEEKMQALVSLEACAYDRDGTSFMVQLKKLSSREDSYRVTSGWGDFLTRNSLVVQSDAEHEDVKLVVFEVWAFRSPTLEVGVRNQPKDPLGLIIIHYGQGECPHGDDVIAKLAAGGSKVGRDDELDESSARWLESLYGFLQLTQSTS